MGEEASESTPEIAEVCATPEISCNNNNSQTTTNHLNTEELDIIHMDSNELITPESVEIFNLNEESEITEDIHSRAAQVNTAPEVTSEDTALLPSTLNSVSLGSTFNAEVSQDSIIVEHCSTASTQSNTSKDSPLPKSQPNTDLALVVSSGSTTIIPASQDQLNTDLALVTSSENTDITPASQELVMSSTQSTIVNSLNSRKRSRKGTAVVATDKSHLQELCNQKKNQPKKRVSNDPAKKRKVAADITNTNQQLTSVNLQVCPYPPFMYSPQVLSTQFPFISARLSDNSCIQTPIIPQSSLVNGQFPNYLQSMYSNLQNNSSHNVIPNPRYSNQNLTERHQSSASIKHAPKITVLNFEK